MAWIAICIRPITNVTPICQASGWLAGRVLWAGEAAATLAHATVALCVLASLFSLLGK